VPFQVHVSPGREDAACRRPETKITRETHYGGVSAGRPVAKISRQDLKIKI